MASNTCVLPVGGTVRHEPCLAMATGSRDAKGINMSVRRMSMAEHTQLCKNAHVQLDCDCLAWHTAAQASTMGQALRAATLYARAMAQVSWGARRPTCANSSTAARATTCGAPRGALGEAFPAGPLGRARWGGGSPRGPP
eukprot:3170848-Alexandrium_andersonii.AAC.1